jgi:hypothetical protein
LVDGVRSAEHSAVMCAVMAASLPMRGFIGTALGMSRLPEDKKTAVCREPEHGG